jgi:hypothetical protein
LALLSVLWAVAPQGRRHAGSVVARLAGALTPTVLRSVRSIAGR